MKELKPEFLSKCLVGEQERVALAETGEAWLETRKRFFLHKDMGAGVWKRLCHPGKFQAAAI